MSKRRGNNAVALREDTNLREELAAVLNHQELLVERLAELELAQEDTGWLKLSGESSREFSREYLTRIITTSRIMYLKSPIINRGVNVQATYVWGQGVNIQANDQGVNELIQGFLDDRANQTELTSHQARTLKEVDLQVLGNIFFVFFTDVQGAVRVRTIPVDEVQDIICNPEDAKDPWWYKRVWTERSLDGGTRQRTAYYPDWRKPVSAGQPSDGEVMKEPVYHVKVGGLSDMRFGVPETYQSLDWAKAYKEFLEDRATIARALSRFAWRMSTPGGKGAIAAAKAKLGTTIGTLGTETNPPPTAGAAFIGAAGGATLDPIRTGGATIHPDEGRRFLLMAIMSMGLPETFYSDASVGSLATAKSLDRPTELRFLDRQHLWTDVHQDIFQFVLDQAVAAGELAQGADRYIEIGFPSILERDQEVTVRSIISAATLDGKESAGTLDDRTLIRLLLTALGLDDVDELIDRIAPEGGESLMAQLRAERQERSQAIADQMGSQGDDQEDDQQEAFTEALRELREAVRQIAGSN